MNIFFTNDNPIIAAKEHCSIHVRKMILEYAQMLSTTVRLSQGDGVGDKLGLYKKTHINHPCTKWVRESDKHYEWLYTCLEELLLIFRQETGRRHKTEALIHPLQTMSDFSKLMFVAPPIVMPDEYKICENVEGCYRNYLNHTYCDFQERGYTIKWWAGEPDWVKKYIET